MSDQQKAMSDTLQGTQPSPSPTRVMRMCAAVTVGGALMGLSGLALTGTIIGLIVATPLLVLTSPITVPAGIVMSLIAGGFLFSGGCGVAGTAALAWIYRYMAGKCPPGAEHIDYARMKIASKAKDMKEKAKEYGYNVNQKSQEAI